MKAETILIQLPHRQHPTHRVLFAMATLMAWVAWISLWLPLTALLAWMLGLRLSYVELVVREHGHGGHDLAMVLALASVCSLIMTAWSSYNYLRFSHQDRRCRSRAVESSAIANALSVHLSTASWMHRASRMVLEFPDGGEVVHREEVTAMAHSVPC